jgi:hypothetical protein
MPKPKITDWTEAWVDGGYASNPPSPRGSSGKMLEEILLADGSLKNSSEVEWMSSAEMLGLEGADAVEFIEDGASWL